VFGEWKVNADFVWEYEVVGFFLLAMVAPLLMSKSQLPKLTKLSYFKISSRASLGSPVILFCLQF
jgi:hypothetical protein